MRILTLLLALSIKSQALPAFPGSEGFGAQATGGRGGTVYEVVNLNDAGPGSLRDAVSTGNRIVVFRVSGTIDLKTALTVAKSNITIAGQSAPGGGICLRNYSLMITGQNIIVRHLRSRFGDLSKKEADAITIWRGAKNVILDHCSATWSTDEALSLGGDVSDITVQWCLIGEALRKSVHAKGEHGYGSLMRANGGVSLHHNLWVHNDARNPRLGDSYDKPPYPLFDVRNNVVYNYGKMCAGVTQGNFKANYVGNFIKPGPNSTAKHPIKIGGPSAMQFFIDGNVFEGNAAQTADNSKFFEPLEIDGKRQVEIVAQPFEVAPVRTTSARQAYDEVLKSVGATLPARDTADLRIIEHVKTRGGRMIDSQTEVGGWPELKSQPAPADTDHDGMPDDWEKVYSLNPQDAADGIGDKDNDGYTNVEEFLNGTNPSEAEPQSGPVNIKKIAVTDVKSLQAAILNIPDNNKNPTVIEIRPGIYKAHFVVPKEKTNLILRGESVEKTILTNDLHINSVLADGKAAGTMGCASTVVLAPDFRAENITFQNNAPRVAQALAIYVDADRAAFKNCRFVGYQDTIRARGGRQFYKDCTIIGRTDFIYGEATSFFENCKIHCLDWGWITAASTPQEQKFGLIFSNCKITAEANVKTLLGRPWRDFASTIWLHTEIHDCIKPEGWHNWDKPQAEKTVRYAEFGSVTPDGKPVDVSNRVKWAKQLTAEEAGQFSKENVLGGWLPD